VLYEERSRKALGDFPLSSRIQGYWNRKGIEIDLVAIDEESKRIRFGTCKRSASKLRSDLPKCSNHVEHFLTEQRRHGRYDETWTVEKVAIAPRIDAETRREISTRGFVPQDLEDLTAGL